MIVTDDFSVKVWQICTKFLPKIWAEVLSFDTFGRINSEGEYHVLYFVFSLGISLILDVRISLSMQTCITIAWKYRCLKLIWHLQNWLEPLFRAKDMSWTFLTYFYFVPETIKSVGKSVYDYFKSFVYFFLYSIKSYVKKYTPICVQ